MIGNQGTDGIGNGGSDTDPPPVEKCDVLVIGGGPAGSSAATFLARAGKRVVLAEGAPFPRFHIGESLLPASVPIFERLGVHEEIRRQFMRKPGGKWFYGTKPVVGSFELADSDCSFSGTRYAYMVERSKFDKVLLDNAVANGVDVRHETDVKDVVVDERGRVSGATLKAGGRPARRIECSMVFDASGQRALLANRLRIRRPNPLKRIALFAHYRGRPLDPHLLEGWFVGFMVPDGWTWMIPLEPGLVSLGTVIPLDRLRAAEANPTEYLERILKSVPTFESGMADAERVSEVRMMGNMGYTSDRFHGDGWVLVGDAAFFIDPCWSSGVHMALMSGEKAANAYLESAPAGTSRFDRYEVEMRHHERSVTKMVEAFYMSTNSPQLQWLVPRLMNDFSQRKFGTFIGGDFSKNLPFVEAIYMLSKVVSRVGKKLSPRASQDMVH